MKKNIFYIVFILILLISTVGCSGNKELAFSRLTSGYPTDQLENFIGLQNGKNGTYLIYDSKKELHYLYLYGCNIVYDDRMAPYFTDINMKLEGNTLIISFIENYTDDYKNKKIDNRVIYRIKHPKDVEFIKIYKNGQQTSFDSVGAI